MWTVRICRYHYWFLRPPAGGGAVEEHQRDDHKAGDDDHGLPVQHPLPPADVVVGEHRHRPVDVPRVPAARVDDVVGELHREEHQPVRRKAQDPAA